MRKFLIIFSVAISSLLCMTACSNDDKDEPSVSDDGIVGEWTGSMSTPIGTASLTMNIYSEAKKSPWGSYDRWGYMNLKVLAENDGADITALSYDKTTHKGSITVKDLEDGDLTSGTLSYDTTKKILTLNMGDESVELTKK